MKRTLAPVLVVASLLTMAAPARAEETSAAQPLTLTLSTKATTSGHAVSVTPSAPCPSPSTGTRREARIAVVDTPGQRVVDMQVVNTGDDGGWTATVTPAGRNGRYWVFAVCETDDGDAYAWYTARPVDVVSPPGSTDPVNRIAGADRIATAIAASEDVFGPASTNTLVLTRSDSYADALAGTPLAALYGGPLLLTGRDRLDPRTLAEVSRVLRPQGTIFVLGGSAAISDAVADDLSGRGYSVDRIAGADRYATAVAVADALGTPTTIVLADGNDYTTGLVAGVAAAAADPSTDGGAVLLTDGTLVPDVTAGYLAGHSGVRRFAVGTKSAAADPGAVAVTGSDPGETSARVAATFFPNVAAVGVASVASFADALSGGAHAAAFGAPLLLTDSSALNDSVAGYLSANRTSIVIAYLYGGSGAVSDATAATVQQAIS